MAGRGHFPVEDPDDTRLGGVEDHVVDLVVPVDQGAAVAGLGGGLFEEGDHVIKVGDRADGSLGVDVDSPRLGGGDAAEGFDLAIVKVGGAAKGGEANRGGRDSVELGEGADSVVPPMMSHGQRLCLLLSLL